MATSRIEMALLGMIAAKPSYAYEIEQFIKDKHMRRWVQIGSASVYQGLERLAKKGLTKSKQEKEGRMPTRRRFNITPAGRAVLKDGVRAMLSQCEDHYADLNLGLFCCHILPPSDIPPLLKERLRKLKAKYQDIRAHGEIFDKRHLWQQGAILDNLREFCLAEEKSLRKTIIKLQTKSR